MNKLSLAVGGPRTEISLEELMHAPAKTIMLKRAAIIWRYNNITVDAVYTFNGSPHVVGAGYWTFSMLRRELEQRSGISLEARPHDGKCKLSNNGSFTLVLGDAIAALLGGFESTTFGPNTLQTSVAEVNVNKGLEAVRVDCSLIALNKNQVQRRRNTLVTLPMTSRQPLFGRMQEFF